MVIVLKGFPSGKCIVLGNILDKQLKMKHIIAETKHWNHAINIGASTSNLSILSKVLFTNTVKIEIILQKKKHKLKHKFINALKI